MQVFGLPRHVIRSAVARWRRAIVDGLTVAQAAKAIGASRAWLYRWEKAPEPKSRRPHQVRKARWTPALAQAVDDLRADNPMWGKRKIAVLLRREGLAVSTSTVGRVLRKLMDTCASSWTGAGSSRCRPCAAIPARGASASRKANATPDACRKA